MVQRENTGNTVETAVKKYKRVTSITPKGVFFDFAFTIFFGTTHVTLLFSEVDSVNFSPNSLK